RYTELRDQLPIPLVSDETHYEGLAHGLLQGEFFQWPGRVPVYPLFIAATYRALGERSPTKLLYVQALVGVVVVPLTYLLARRLTGTIPALVAAGGVVFDDALVGHAREIYAEILYLPLLLGAVLVLPGAEQVPRLGRFAGAGASMAIVTLCRPTTALIPLMVPWLLPKSWQLKRKVEAFLVYGLAMAAVIAPWTYHNWRQYQHFLPLSVSV